APPDFRGKLGCLLVHGSILSRIRASTKFGAVHSVFSKNRDRLIEFDAATDLLKATVETAHKRGLLSGEHFSVDGMLIQAWASHKSLRRKDGSDDDRPPENWHGETRSNATHESSSDGDSRLYRKSNAAPALPSYLGHLLTDKRRGLVVNVQASQANGRAEREVAVQMLRGVARLDRPITVGADKGYNARGFVQACRDVNVTPHLDRNTKRTGGSAIDKRTTRHLGYAVSQRKRKCIEQYFGCGKSIGLLRQVMVQGLEKVDQLLPLTMAAYNLTRLRTLAALRPQAA
ncbi:IS5 family transposase, partial [Burkholderia glumae]|uniref:IS5 family transposase n=1 Tax=Burkholderia glumae TaxID=337 RepID=UPI001FC7D187